MQQRHDTRMLGRFAFPRVDNHEIITVESDALLPPSVAPSESCSNNCKEFLPLDRHVLKAADVGASHGETTPLESMHHIHVCQKHLCIAPGLLHLWVVGQQIARSAQAVRPVWFWSDHFFTQAKKQKQKVPCRLRSVWLYGMAEKVIEVQ